MIDFGVETETTTLDDSNSTLSIIRKVRDRIVAKTYKQYKIRVKVKDAKEEMAEYIKHSETVREKKELGVLLFKDDGDFMPAFMVEYPKVDQDGSYFVTRSWTELTA